MLRRVGTVGSVGVAYHIPAAAHPDWAPLSLLGGIISQPPNGRLYKALVESKKATSADRLRRQQPRPRPVHRLGPGRAGPARRRPRHAGEDARKPGDVPFTEDEVDKAKVRSKRNAEMLQSNSTAMAQALSSASASATGGCCSSSATASPPSPPPTSTAWRRPISRSPTAPSASTSRRRSRSGWPSPAAPAIDDGREGLQGRHRGGGRRGVRPDRRPTSTPALKIVDLGGIKAGLLPKKNRGETVSLVLTLHYGNEESLKGQTTAAGMLPALMMAGTKKHDRQALREELDRARHPHLAGAGGGGGRGGRRRRWRRQAARRAS